MSIFFTQQILSIIAGLIGSTVAVLGLFFKQWVESKMNKILKRFLGIGCIIVIFVYVANCAYAAILTNNQINADLYITLATPYLVNVGGTYTEPFIPDANYSVVAYNRVLPLDTTIELVNIKTNERFTYNPSFADFGEDLAYRIANISSGEYDIKISTEGYPQYEERIILSAQNFYSNDEIGAYRWNFTAFIFDDFYNNSTCFDIYLGDIQNNVSKPLFGIWSENVDTYELFKSDIDWNNNGHMTGKFYGYKDIYYVGNAITDTEMETKIINVQ